MNALPLPVLTDRRRTGRSCTPTCAAEAFFDMSLRVMQRQKLTDFVPFGSPVLGARRRGAAARRQRQRVPRRHRQPAARRRSASSTFSRRRSARTGDSVVADASGAHHRRQDGPAADPSRRRPLDHGARRDAGARDQEPALGHPRRGAAPRAIGRRERPGADPADLRRDRPDREARRADGAVRRRAAGRARRRSTSTACSTT